MTKAEITATAWRRLQYISCERANALYATGKTRRMFGRGVIVPEEIEENVKILGRANEEEMKARLMWYLTYHSELFGTMLKALSMHATEMRRVQYGTLSDFAEVR